ncbi:T9SS type A sorting domain-containing protein [Polaribacter marinivivus]|uniref:T9SS type A sorting domain-containing protein n=1 Tax=Polaribacter marinivivus TaxID=1524260 RepID=UPI003D3379A2
MKKNYFLTLLITFCFSYLAIAQELLVNGDFESWDDSTSPTSWSKAENTTQESTEVRSGTYSAKMTASGTKDIAQTIGGIIAGESYTITLWYKVASGDNTDARIWSYWRDASNSNIDNNDNDTEDAIRGPNNNYLDNNSGNWTEYKTTITAPANATQFYFELRVYGSAVVYWDDLSFFKNTTSTDPSLVISSPSNNQVFQSTTTEVPITLGINNFTVSGDAGGGVSDNSGDGYLKTTLQETGQADVMTNFFTATPSPITVVSGRSYTATVELVDNSGNPFNPKVEASVAFSVALPCDIQLSTIVTTCDATTSGTDTYTTSIDFTAGNTTTYTITAKDINNNDVGTIGGDNPSTSASGTITITGVPEGTDFTVKVIGGTGSSCDLTRDISSPTCFPLPIYEDFSYTDGSLTSNPLWNGFSGTSGDLMVESGQAVVQHGTPSEDAQIQFEPVSGNIYYALDFTVVDPGNPIPGTDNEYFALFKDTGFGFVGRLDIVPPTNSGDFTVGIATDGGIADSVWATDLSYGVKYRATVKYDQDKDIAQLWINASSETDTSILGADLEDPGRTVVAFALRQSDSDLNEKILVDNLKIGATFSETTLSSSIVEIQGFAIYPNPVSNGRLTITSNSTDSKQVSIFNVLGKNVLNTTISGTKAEVNTSGISAGIYILKVVEGGKTATSKLIIR